MGYIGAQPATNFETVRKQVSTTNSGTTITLDYSVSSVQDILVTVNAVVQSYDNYTVSGTTLTLGGTLNNDRVEILYVGRTFQTVTPAIGTVTNDMLSGSIANSKLANSSITLNGSAVSLGGSATVGAKNFFSAYNPSNNVANDTNVKIIFQNESFDTASAYDTSNGRFTVPSGEGGKYFLYAKIRHYNSTSMTREQIDLRVNGSKITMYEHKGDNIHNSIQISDVADLSAGDYVEVFYYQNSGSSNNISTFAGADESEFKGYRIA